MMNFVTLALVLSSLAIAEVWSPSPEKHGNQKEHLIVKEEHRVTVIQYDEDGQVNTKVSPSQQQQHVSLEPGKVSSDMVGQAKEEVKEASASVLPISKGESRPPKELICDVVGKCKHKIASAIGRAKDTVAEMAHEAHEAVDGVEDAYERVKDKAPDVKERAEDEAKSTFKTAKDTGKTIGEDVARNVSEKIENIIHRTKHAINKVKTGACNFFNEISHSFLHNTQALKDLMSVVTLLGFSTAYGMCLWVTFISSHVLAGALPRQQFGVVQSKIYPAYFRAMACSIGMALLGHSLEHRRKMFAIEAELFQGYILMASILMVLANMLYLEPRATKVMFEKMKIEKEEGRGRESYEAKSTRGDESHPVADPSATTTTDTARSEIPFPGQDSSDQEVTKARIVRLSNKLKMLNYYSSFLNIMSLMVLTWHLVYLGGRLHLNY
ncbi:DUF4149 domain-containing protein [Cephalotus follicularis]|uniref:DUF4149 domain-containing protein n=1 Tax=Cephalotus follicularis TaxID=3775 RepID=A0A1Q3CWX8_CEPFO|nr:DUF4149 domain-containing protein [Cephalotus follicularis]